MNHNMSPVAHLKWMLVAAGAVLVVLAVTGVPLSRALFYAALLACPLMMVFMMFSMIHGQHGGRGAAHHHEPHAEDGRPMEDAPIDEYDPRWSERRP